jgi:uncharacterized protein (TIGR01777 family)
MKKILISGATGMVGKKLVQRLLDEGFEINILSTRKGLTIKHVNCFWWNPLTFEMETEALDGVDVIINLAGATVSKRWTTAYKQEIFDSRTRSSETFFKALQKLKNNTVTKYISASGVGYYPSHESRIYSESDAAGSDFLAQVCKQWELSADQLTELGVEVVKLRTGVVLGKGEGVLEKLEKVTRMGMGAALGTGKQWVSWIHIDDLCELYFTCATSHSIEGVVNAVAPYPVTNDQLGRTLAQVLGKPYFLPPVPAAFLKIMLGEMSAIALSSQKVSAKKVLDLGFHFKFIDLENALRNIYKG